MQGSCFALKKATQSITFNFLATLLALVSTPYSHLVGGQRFNTNLASRLASLFKFYSCHFNLISLTEALDQFKNIKNDQSYNTSSDIFLLVFIGAVVIKFTPQPHQILFQENFVRTG